MKRRPKIAIAVGVGVFVVLVLVFGVVSRHVPGSVSRANVQSGLAGTVSSASSAADCTGPLTAMQCTVRDDSGTPGRYLVRASGSCWQATRQDVSGEGALPATAHRCVRLWDDIFPNGLFG